MGRGGGRYESGKGEGGDTRVVRVKGEMRE